jgi:pimeloyl-ACP methyl ester carboxylesterase
MSPRYQNTAGERPKSVLPRKTYELAFVEFGEQGSYLDTSQIEAAVTLVRSTRRPLVVTYVHGWHNDSGSKDVERFSNFLEQVATAPSIHGQQYNVIGVYLGWRGDLTKVPLLSELTFFSRKSAAERLANNFDCFDAISSIAEAAHGHHSRSAQYTILIGHSFGGLVVERAVAHALDEKMHGRNAKGAEMPADLTLVWNPASDSILSRQIMAALDQWQTANTRPLFVSVTSTADWATGTMFPLATTLASTAKAFPEVADPGTNKPESERNYLTSTPGHKPELINRELEPSSFSLRSTNGLNALQLNLSHNLTGDVVALPANGGGVQLWQISHGSGPDVPYWNIQVDKRIITSHGDVWNEKTEALLAGLFRIANPLHPIHAEASFRNRVFTRDLTKQPRTAPTPPLSPSASNQR